MRCGDMSGSASDVSLAPPPVDTKWHLCLGVSNQRPYSLLSQHRRRQGQDRLTLFRLQQAVAKSDSLLEVINLTQLTGCTKVIACTCFNH